MAKYTVVFYDEETLELLDTEPSHTAPDVDANCGFYIVEGEFSGVVDPSDGVDAKSEEDRLREENEKLRADNDTNALALLDLANVLLNEGGGA